MHFCHAIKKKSNGYAKRKKTMGEKSRHMAFCILQNFPLLLIALFILNIVKIVNLGPWRFSASWSSCWDININSQTHWLFMVNVPANCNATATIQPRSKGNENRNTWTIVSQNSTKCASFLKVGQRRQTFA